MSEWKEHRPELDVLPIIYERTAHGGADQQLALEDDGLTVQESMSGYSGYTATVFIPIAVLKAMMKKLEEM